MKLGGDSRSDLPSPRAAGLLAFNHQLAADTSDGGSLISSKLRYDT
jgi:hypothetical protein